MAVEVILPRVDMAMDSGAVARWAVKNGDTVKPGDLLFEMSTDKSVMEVEASAAGVVSGIAIEEGVDVPVGTVLAWILAPGESEPIIDKTAKTAKKQAGAQDVQPSAVAEASSSAKGFDSNPAQHHEGLRATPLARRFARERGIDLKSLSGSGPFGRIEARDLPLDSNKSNGTTRPVAMRRWLAPDSTQRTLRPTIMLVHGFASQAATWENIGPALAEQGFDVFAPDLAGHGRATLDVDQFDSIVASLVTAITALAPRRNIHLVGHSMGAAACVFAYGQTRNQIARLTLLAPAGLGSAIDHEFISAIASVSDSETLKPLLDKLTSRPIKYTAKQLDAMAADLGQGRLKDLAQALIQDGQQVLDIRGTLSTLRCPVDVFFGVKDQIIPWTQIAALEPSIAVHLFREAGHMIHVDEPLALVKLLASGAF